MNGLRGLGQKANYRSICSTPTCDLTATGVPKQQTQKQGSPPVHSTEFALRLFLPLHRRP
jgi:hypothetical protein